MPATAFESLWITVIKGKGLEGKKGLFSENGVLTGARYYYLDGGVAMMDIDNTFQIALFELDMPVLYREEYHSTIGKDSTTRKHDWHYELC